MADNLSPGKPIVVFEFPAITHLSASRENGQRFVAVESSPPIDHLRAIEEAAWSLKLFFDSFRQEAHKKWRDVMYSPDSIKFFSSKVHQDAYIKQTENHLQYLHNLRVVLVREAKRYLPDVRITLLKDFRFGWMKNWEQPNWEYFLAELENVTHEANRQAVKILDEQSAITASAPSGSTTNDFTPRQQAIISVLKKVRKGYGLEGKEILDKLPKRYRKLSESTLRRHDFPALIATGKITNTPGVGYHLPH